MEKILEATLKWKMKPENHLHLMIASDDKRQNCGRRKNEDIVEKIKMPESNSKSKVNKTSLKIALILIFDDDSKR